MSQLIFDRLLEAAGVTSAPDVWRTHWDAAQSSFPLGGPDFLDPKYMENANEILRLDDGKVSVLLKTADFYRKSDTLRRFIWLWHYVLFTAKERFDDWPAPESLGEFGDLTHALVLIGALPALKEQYHALGIGNEVMADTLSDLTVNMNEYHVRFGRPGIGAFRIGWLLNHFTGKLFRLGRLQFMLAPFNPVRPEDMALPISPGDEILEVHIAKGSPLHYEACQASYGFSADFYARHFPAAKIKAFTCCSWLLSPDIDVLLPPNSNIIRFKKDFTVYDVSDSDGDVLDYVYERRYDKMEDLPEDTSLRRALKKSLLSGGRIRAASGAILY